LTFRVFPLRSIVTRFVRNGDATSWTWLLLQSSVQIADLTCARSPLVGFVHWCPSADISVVRPLPAEPEDSTFGILAPTRLRVPSSWFHTTSTVYSARQIQVYCNLYRPGFVVFGRPRPPPQQAGSRPDKRFPATRAPLEEPSSSAAVLHLCSRFPLVFIPRYPARSQLLRRGSTNTRDETNPRSSRRCKQLRVSLSVSWNPVRPLGSPKRSYRSDLGARRPLPEGTAQLQQIGK